MLKTKAKPRKTPWDPRAIKPRPYNFHPRIEPHPNEKLEGGVRLHGVYVFEPRATTSIDMRRFFCTGLQLLDSNAKSLGLPLEEVRLLMHSSFDKFHDAADGLWVAVKQMAARSNEAHSPATAITVRCRSIPTGIPIVGIPATRRSRTSFQKLRQASPTSQSIVEVIKTKANIEQGNPLALLNESEVVNKYQDVEDFPVADFYEPAGYGWTQEGYEVRSAIKRYSEATNAHS